MTIAKSLKIEKGYHHRMHRAKKNRKNMPYGVRKALPYKRKKVRIVLNKKYKKIIKVI